MSSAATFFAPDGLGARLNSLCKRLQGSGWAVALSLVCAQATWAEPLNPQALQSYEVGLDARARGDLNTASLAFEQALMLAPSFAGAWFDYGTTLCELGDPVGCRNILNSAIAQFGLPPALQQQLGQAMRFQQGELRVGLGASTNLLRATGADDLTLLLDGTEVKAVLADSYRERGGGLAEAAFNYQSSWPLQNMSFRSDFLARRPFDQDLPSLHLAYLEAGLGLERFGLSSRTRAGVLALGLDEGYLGGLWSTGLWAEHQLRPGGSLLRGSIERRKPREQSAWWTTRLAARIPLATDWRLGVGLEYDSPQSDRAGYSQTRYLLDLRHERNLPAVGQYVPRLTLDASVLHARDRKPYSALFGDVRSTRTRWQARADLSVNLSRHWRLSLELLAARQKANIVLFDYSEVSGMLSVTYRFE